MALREKVTMVHRSGGKIIHTPGLQKPPLGRLPDGRVVKLRCDDLDAWFTRATGKGAPVGLDTDGGPQVGPLRVFQAVGSVSLTDGPMTADGQKVLYDAIGKEVTVWGFLPDAAEKTNARLTWQDAATQQLRTLESPKLEYNLETQSAKVGAIEGGGGEMIWDLGSGIWD